MRILKAITLIVSICMLVFGCADRQIQVTEVKNYELNSLDGLIAQDGIEFDREISSDGLGSIKMTAAESTTVSLFETGDIDIEDARLIYRAKLKTGDFDGQVFLEMWCSFPGRGEYFSRDLQSPISGTVDWTTEETFFFLKQGENPDNVKLNLVVNGTGTVWIDDIQLLKAPLN